MNIERLESIAEWLESGAPHRGAVDGFSMARWQMETTCGTVCCIAGAANQFFGDPDANKLLDAGEMAREVLGLSGSVAIELFTQCESIADWSQISEAWAARTIRHLISTGDVDWEACR